MSERPNPVTIPCACKRMATLFEDHYDDGNSWQVKCACGLEGAVLTYKKPEDRVRTAWAALDGWRISNGSGRVQ